MNKTPLPKVLDCICDDQPDTRHKQLEILARHFKITTKQLLELFEMDFTGRELAHQAEKQLDKSSVSDDITTKYKASYINRIKMAIRRCLRSRTECEGLTKVQLGDFDRLLQEHSKVMVIISLEGCRKCDTLRQGMSDYEVPTKYADEALHFIELEVGNGTNNAKEVIGYFEEKTGVKIGKTPTFLRFNRGQLIGYGESKFVELLKLLTKSMDLKTTFETPKSPQ